MDTVDTATGTVDAIDTVDTVNAIDSAVDAADGTERHRPGRPRSEHCDVAIRRAATELLVEEGFGRMTMEGVAARAGVGKATIYRRWPTKEGLIVDAIAQRCRDHLVMPDSGSLRADLVALYRSVLERFRRDGSVMLAFLDERERHPELAELFRSTFLADRRAVVREILERGVARGELAADADLELLGDVGPAMLWHRFAISGEPLTDDLPERIVDQFFPAASL